MSAGGFSSDGSSPGPTSITGARTEPGWRMRRVGFFRVRVRARNALNNLASVWAELRLQLYILEMLRVWLRSDYEKDKGLFLDRR